MTMTEESSWQRWLHHVLQRFAGIIQSKQSAQYGIGSYWFGVVSDALQTGHDFLSNGESRFVIGS